MKTRLITALLMLAVAIGIFGSANSALATPVWQIGTIDGAIDPIDGADEYPVTNTTAPGLHYDVFNYTVGTDLFPISDPSMVGFLGYENVSSVDPNRPYTDATSVLNIDFNLSVDHSDAELIYGKYGSESDLVSFGANQWSVGGTDEGSYQLYSLYLGDLLAGGHTITLTYTDGGRGNGHYIDYIALNAEPVPEPATMLLLGTGLVGLAGLRRKFKK